MIIKLYMPKAPGNEVVKRLLSDFILVTANRVGVPEKHIDTVGLAYSENYSDAVSELFPNGRFTNKGGYLGVGKTKSEIIDEKYCHKILLNAFVMEMILQGFNQSQNILDWSADFQIGPFIISHELGHCKDFELRGEEVADSGHIEMNDGFDLDKVHHYYNSILISEFSACIHGDSFYTVDFFKNQIPKEKEALEQNFDELEKIKSDVADPYRILHVAEKASAVAWMYLIQYSKLWTGKQGSFFEAEPIANLWRDDIDNKINKGLIDDHLNYLYSTYPKIKKDDVKLIMPAWNHVCNCMGYKFELKGTDWCCFWNTGTW